MKKSSLNIQSSGSESAPSEIVGTKSQIVRELVTDEVKHAMAALALAPGAERAWIVESGASKHFTGNLHVYSSLEVSHNSSPVFSAKGQTHAIHRRGNVDFKLPSAEIKTIKDTSMYSTFQDYTKICFLQIKLRIEDI